jgi:(R,R)-butanediol dehydrogenase/meso-butanediol dehydrogenase/diacetyl reductase
MKALRWHNREDVRIDDIPAPTPRADEVLIEVLYSGICGSEVHEYLSGPLYIPLEPHPLTGTCAPQTMGHEFGGRVVALGSDVTAPAVGTLVAVNPLLSCGVCKPCLRNRPNLCDKLANYGLIGDGGHAEMAAVKAASCVPLPPGTPPEYGAFGEPAAVAFHAVNQARIKPGASVAVLGAGPIGQLVAQYARLAGAEKLLMTEIATDRIAVAKKIGTVDRIFNPLDVDVMEAILSETDGQGVDCAIECCGGAKTGMLEDTAAQAIEMTRSEGVTVIVGGFAAPPEFNFNSIVMMERIVVGSWIWHAPDEYAAAVKMLVEDKIQTLPLVTRRVPIDKAIEDGILALRYQKDKHVKILVDLT